MPNVLTNGKQTALFPKQKGIKRNMMPCQKLTSFSKGCLACSFSPRCRGYRDWLIDNALTTIRIQRKHGHIFKPNEHVTCVKTGKKYVIEGFKPNGNPLLREVIAEAGDMVEFVVGNK